MVFGSGEGAMTGSVLFGGSGNGNQQHKRISSCCSKELDTGPCTIPNNPVDSFTYFVLMMTMVIVIIVMMIITIA